MQDPTRRRASRPAVVAKAAKAAHNANAGQAAPAAKAIKAAAAAAAAGTTGAPPPGAAPWLPIGELARRAGVAASALRFYEAQGLIESGRSGGGRRLYPRHVLRRVAFIRAAQAVGLSLEAVRASLATLPAGRTPTKADWSRLAREWQPLLDARIAELTTLRARLASCIGCGCLSLKACALYNPQDEAGRQGPGARYIPLNRPV